MILSSTSRMVSKKSFKLLVVSSTTPFFAFVQIIYFLDCSLNLCLKLFCVFLAFYFKSFSCFMLLCQGSQWTTTFHVDVCYVIVFCVFFIYYLSISFFICFLRVFLFFLMQFSSITISQVSNCHLALPTSMSRLNLIICFIILIFLLLFFCQGSQRLHIILQFF